MRYAIKQTSPSGQLWLVRATKQGVWAAEYRAKGFYSRLPLERWLTKVRMREGVSCEIVEIAEDVEQQPAEAQAG